MSSMGTQKSSSKEEVKKNVLRNVTNLLEMGSFFSLLLLQKKISKMITMLQKKYLFHLGTSGRILENKEILREAAKKVLFLVVRPLRASPPPSP